MKKTQAIHRTWLVSAALLHRLQTLKDKQSCAQVESKRHHRTGWSALRNVSIRNGHGKCGCHRCWRWWTGFLGYHSTRWQRRGFLEYSRSLVEKYRRRRKNKDQKRQNDLNCKSTDRRRVEFEYYFTREPEILWQRLQSQAADAHSCPFDNLQKQYKIRNIDNILDEIEDLFPLASRKSILWMTFSVQILNGYQVLDAESVVDWSLTGDTKPPSRGPPGSKYAGAKKQGVQRFTLVWNLPTTKDWMPGVSTATQMMYTESSSGVVKKVFVLLLTSCWQDHMKRQWVTPSKILMKCWLDVDHAAFVVFSSLPKHRVLTKGQRKVLSRRLLGPTDEDPHVE